MDEFKIEKCPFCGRSYRQNQGLFFTFPHCAKEVKAKKGWVKEKFYAYKMVGQFEITIEFCDGDFCVGIFNEKHLLLESKQSCPTVTDALVTAAALEKKYKNRDA